MSDGSAAVLFVNLAGFTVDCYEKVEHSKHGQATLSVCKWVDELDGRRLVFGISFVIPG